MISFEGMLMSLTVNLIDQWRIQDFPLRGGGRRPVGGGSADLRRVHFLAKTYAKMKEIDPVGGGGRRRRPPGSAND